MFKTVSLSCTRIFLNCDFLNYFEGWTRQRFFHQPETVFGLDGSAAPQWMLCEWESLIFECGKQFLDVRRSWLWVILLTELPVSGTLSNVSIQWCAFLTGVETADCCCFAGFIVSCCCVLCRSVTGVGFSFLEGLAVLNKSSSKHI